MKNTLGPLGVKSKKKYNVKGGLSKMYQKIIIVPK
jgi:hypothetical protein